MNDKPSRRLRTPAELAESLRRMKEFSAKVDAVPESERVPMTNPGKYSAPLGADAHGNIVSYKRLEDVPDDPRTRRQENAVSGEKNSRVTALSSALAKLPKHAAVVYRGTSLTPDVVARYQAGAVVTERGFTSTTKDVAQAVSGNTCFVVLSGNGRDISALSQVPSEQEVLFDHGTDFLVIDRILDPASGVSFISLAERLIEGAEIPAAEFSRIQAALGQAISALQARLARYGVPPARSAPSKFDDPIGATNDGGVLVTGRFFVTGG